MLSRPARSMALLTLTAVVSWASAAAPAHLYVAPDGNDANSGRTRDAALRTLTKAVEMTTPGVEVIVAGGVYTEYVFVDRGGESGKPVVFRAAPGETPIVTMGRRPRDWTRVPDTRFTWSTAWDQAPDYLWEDRTVTRYATVSAASALDETPGSFHYDSENRRLLVNCLYSLPPTNAGIVTVNYPRSAAPRSRRQPFSGGYDHYSYAAFFVDAPHVRIEGITACYLPTGFHVYNEAVEIRHCVAYGCARGIMAFRGRDTVIEGNRCFRNDGHGINIAGERSGERLGRRNVDVLIKDNDCRENGPMGPFRYPPFGGDPKNVAIYGAPENVTLIGNLALSKRPEFNWRYKGGYSGRIVTNGNVLVGASAHIGFGQNTETCFNTVVSGGLRQYGHPKYRITPANAAKTGARAEGNLYCNRPLAKYRFADAVRLDYRLLADSAYLGQGAFPEPAPVRFVSPGGDDASDGRTPESAWRSLAHAARTGRAGDTLYVMPGAYRESVKLETGGIVLKTWGRGHVEWYPSDDSCALEVQGAGAFILDGFVFAGFHAEAVVIGADVEATVRDCVFDGAGVAVALVGSRGLVAEGNTFVGCRTAVTAREAADLLVLRNCLFKDLSAAPIEIDRSPNVISEACAFAGRNARTRQTEARRVTRETHSSSVTELRFADAAYRLPFGDPLGYAGVGHAPVGARGTVTDPTPILIEDFRATAVSATQAVLTWYTPGRYPDAVVTYRSGTREPVTVRAPQLPWQGILRHARRTLRLTDLEGGEPVTLTLALHGTDGAKAERELVFAPTAANRPPTTLYVNPMGADANDGLSRTSAVRTLTAAMLKAVPGDTILAASGEYREKVQFYTGGLSAEQPLILKSETPGAATIHCGRLRPGALVLENLEHVVVDGFTIAGLWFTSHVTAVKVAQCRDISLRNLRFERIPGCSCQLVHLSQVRQALIEDCLFPGGFYNLVMAGCDDVTVRHNVFHWSGVDSIQAWGAADARYRITHNILLDGVPSYKSNPAIWVAPEKVPNLVCDGNLHWRETSHKMALLGFSPQGGAPVTIRCDTFEQVRELGYETRGAYAAPLFIDTSNSDYRLQPGSPAMGMGSGGTTVGIRFRADTQ